MTQPKPLLCHPDQEVVVRGFRGICPRCGSYWDLESCAMLQEYTDSYPGFHKHFDRRIGALKVRTLVRWLSKLGVDPGEQVVCEIGFGGGFCLAHLQGTARQVFGLEAVSLSISHAASLGVPETNLFSFQDRPPRLPESVSLWLFQDSFEHILEPDALLPWVADNATEDARLLLVSPNAVSLSQRWMGRYWPHKLPEHLFHWSPAGVCHRLGEYGFTVRRRFRTTKRVSTDQLVNHLSLTSSLRWAAPLLRKVVPSFETWFNLGQMGILLQRRAAEDGDPRGRVRHLAR